MRVGGEVGVFCRLHAQPVGRSSAVSLCTDSLTVVPFGEDRRYAAVRILAYLAATAPLVHPLAVPFGLLGAVFCQ